VIDFAEQYPIGTLQEAQTSLVRAYYDLQTGAISPEYFSDLQLHLTLAMKRLKRFEVINGARNKKAALLAGAARLSVRSIEPFPSGGGGTGWRPRAAASAKRFPRA
jgi:hypothetical protein